jgi:hypothetical protein
MLAQFYMCAIYCRHFTWFTFVVTGDWKPGKRNGSLAKRYLLYGSPSTIVTIIKMDLIHDSCHCRKGKSMEARSQAGSWSNNEGKL